MKFFLEKTRQVFHMGIGGLLNCAVYLTVKEEQCGQKNKDGQEWAGDKYLIDKLGVTDMAHILAHWTDTWNITAIQ